MSRGVVRRRGPVRGPDESGTSARALCRGLHACSNRTALRINAPRPIELLHERKSGEEFSIGAVQNVERPSAIGLDKQSSRLLPVVRVDQDGSLRSVVVIQVVRRKLKIPFELSRIRVQGQNTSGVKIVPMARTAIKIGSGIAGAPINCIQFGIVCAWHPGGAAAALVQFAGPALGAKLAGTGNCPKAPHFLSSLYIEGGDESADAVITAGRSNQHFVLHDQWCARCSVILVSFRVRNVPQ